MDRQTTSPVALIGTVLVTCILSASALSLTYGVTRDRIIAQEVEAQARALRAVVPEGESFEPFDEQRVMLADEAAGDIDVIAGFEALGPQGDLVGWGFRVAPRGYGGPMHMVVGLDRDGKVLGVSVVTQNETPGLGTKILTEPGFMDQFEGWDALDIDRVAREYDAISGATRSSRGIQQGVIAAAKAWAATSDAGSGEGGAQ